MRGNRCRRIVCLALAALAAFAGDVRAEISADPGENCVGVLMLGVIEGPDPIPQIIWEPVRDIDPTLILNPDGAVRGDGRPDVAIDPATGWPHVVWAYFSGPDFDIAYSHWDGSGWTEPEFLTSSAANQLDPRIYIDATATYVTWWEQSAQRVWLKTRLRGAAWEPAEQVADQNGMRPTVVTWGGTVFVASEVDDGQGGREIVLSTLLESGSFSSQFVNESSGDQPLELMLHNEWGQLWMDWRHADDQFAYSEFDGSEWTPPQTVPWLDESWLNLEQVRLTIRNLVVY